MPVCITDSLINAVEVAKNLIQKKELNPAQEKALKISFGLITLCKKFFDININRHELEIIKSWQIDNEDITELFLARKKDKYFLYSTFVDSGIKALGIFIPDKEIKIIQELNNENILNYFNTTVLTR